LLDPKVIIIAPQTANSPLILVVDDGFADLPNYTWIALSCENAGSVRV